MALVILIGALAIAAASAPVVVGVREGRRAEAVAGGLLGCVAVVWLLAGFMSEAFCDGTCGRDAGTLYVAAAIGLGACALLAAAVVMRAPRAACWALVVAGVAALAVGASRW